MNTLQVRVKPVADDLYPPLPFASATPVHALSIGMGGVGSVVLTDPATTMREVLDLVNTFERDGLKPVGMFDRDPRGRITGIRISIVEPVVIA